MGGYREEHSSQVRTGTFVDAQSIPRVGGGLLRPRDDGRGRRLRDKSFIPEVVAPLGVEVAISDANPVRCHYTLPDGSDTALGGCPQRLQTGPHGGLSLAPDGNPNNAWTGVGKIAGTPALTRPQVEIVHIEFPLRASRPMKGLPGGPTCTARTLRTGLCNRDAAGDFLQVAVTVYDVSIPVLTPAIGLVVSASGDSTPARGSLVTVPRSMRLRSAVNGIPLRVMVPADGARVSATLTAKGLGRISVVKRNGVKAGSLRLRMKPTRQAARKLRRASAVAASLRVTVKVPGQPTIVETNTIRLRR